MATRAGAAALIAGVLALAATGCAGARPLMAAPADYAAFRATRVAPTLDARLAAASRYLDEHADGLWAADVDRWFDRAEPVFFASKRGSVAGLEAYLRALPRGPHASEAVRRLGELRARQAQGADGTGGIADALERRMQRAAAGRAAVGDSMRRWLGWLLDPPLWRGPISEAPGELVVEWSLKLPAPVCAPAEGAAPAGAARRCAKLVELPYSIPVGGVAEPREVTLEIAIVEDGAGRPLEVTLGGPELFARLEEARSNKPVAAADAGAGIAAVAGAIGLVTGELGRRGSLPASCKRPVVAPVVLDLACDGWHVTARAGEGAADDVVVIQREAVAGR